MTLRVRTRPKRKVSSLRYQVVKKSKPKLKRKNGQVIRPVRPARSPLDVRGIDLGVTTAEIVQFIREGRREYSAGNNQVVERAAQSVSGIEK